MEEEVKFFIDFPLCWFDLFCLEAACRAVEYDLISPVLILRARAGHTTRSLLLTQQVSSILRSARVGMQPDRKRILPRF